MDFGMSSFIAFLVACLPFSGFSDCHSQVVVFNSWDLAWLNQYSLLAGQRGVTLVYRQAWI